jgi:hypothetical protein
MYRPSVSQLLIEGSSLTSRAPAAPSSPRRPDSQAEIGQRFCPGPGKVAHSLELIVNGGSGPWGPAISCVQKLAAVPHSAPTLNYDATSAAEEWFKTGVGAG